MQQDIKTIKNIVSFIGVFVIGIFIFVIFAFVNLDKDIRLGLQDLGYKVDGVDGTVQNERAYLEKSIINMYEKLMHKGEDYDPDRLDKYDTEMCDGLGESKIAERYTGYEGYYCTREDMNLNHLRGGCNGPIYIKCENLLIYEDEYRQNDACDGYHYPYKVIASKVSDRLPGWNGYLTKEYLLNNCKAFNYIKEG